MNRTETSASAPSVQRSTSASCFSTRRTYTGCRPEYVKSACYPRLAQLAVTHIDLCYAHRLDLAVPVEDTVGAKAELVVAGKVRAIGLSEVSADELRSARGASDHRVAERLFDLGAVARIECHTCMPGAS